MNNTAWNVFKNTGDIKAYLEFREIKNIEEDIKEKLNETIKGKWNSNFRE